MARGEILMDGRRDSREGEENYKNLFEDAREAIVLTDLNGTITGVNRLVEDYGFQREQLVGKSLFGFVAEDYRTRAMADFKVLLGGKPVKGEMEVLTPKGVFYAEYRDNPIVRGDRIVGVQAILADVTKRKRAEQLLWDERDRAQKYLDIAGVMLVVIDSEQRVGLINKKGCEILGYTEQEILGKNWFDNFLPPRVKEHTRAVFDGLMAGQADEYEHVEGVVLTQDGPERTIGWHNTLLKDETGQIVGTLSSGEDITERKRAEQEVARLASFPQLNPNPVLEVDANATITFQNDAARALLEQVRKDARVLLPADLPEILRAFAQKRSRMIYREVQVDDLILGESIYHVPSLNVARIYTMDITERKRAEEAYRSLVDHSLQGLVIFQEGKAVFANQAMAEIAGYTIDEIFALSAEQIRDFVHPEDRAIVWRNHRRRLAGEPVPEHYEMRGLRKDGRVRWLDIHASRIDYRGKPAIQAAYIDITGRKQAEESLRLTEERFRTLYESVQAGVLLLQADGTILHANRMACDILGMTWESLEFKTPMNLDWQLILEDGTPVPGQDYPSMTTLRTGEPIRGAVRGFFSGDPARPRWLVINTEPVRQDKEGAVEQVMVTFHDITALKQAEHETRESHRFLLTVMNSFPGNVAIIDEEANIVMTNDSWAAFGQANSLAPHFLEKGVNYLQVCRAARGDGSDGAQDAAQALDAILEERRNYFEMEYPCHSPDRNRWFHLQAQGFAFEDKRWVVLAHLDITERKKMEESLRESEARFATIFRASPVPIAISRLSDHRLIDVNDRWQGITGCSRAEALGHTPVELNLWVDPEQQEHVIEVLLEKGTVREEVQIRRKSGEINDVLMSAELIELAGERYLLTLAQDITERKKVEQRLLDYQNRLRELAMELTLAEERERRRIAVGVHDRIGQRLAMAKLTLQSLQTSTLETNTARALEEVCKDVDKVLEDAHALTFELSNPILYEVGFEPAVESWLFQQVRDRQGIECTFEAQECRAGLDKETRVVLFDIVRELLTNVIKHAKARHVNVGIRCLEGTVHVSVGDDGIGFQPPRTGTHVSESGGFGLFNIREKLDYLGGSITMESAPGEGTRVVVVVPLTYPRNLGKKERNHEDLDRR
jgi:PAS domain S-box-containing protein